MLVENSAQLVTRRRAGQLHPLLPEATTDTAHHYEALAQGRLELQCCMGCRKLRYPLGPVCPWCHEGQSEWLAVSGAGRVHSWVRYHRSFVPTFDELVPYEVVHVQLAEGPRLTGRYLGPTKVSTGLGVQACLEKWDDSGIALCFITDSDSA